MDYTTSAITYGLLFLPAMFSLVIVGQGIEKIRKGDQHGKIIVVLGILFLLLIPAAYFFLIQV